MTRDDFKYNVYVSDISVGFPYERDVSYELVLTKVTYEEAESKKQELLSSNQNYSVKIKAVEV